jgi:GntR family transcriptional regulator|tara:strand:- start:7726 stop:8514 length:789 start_codon:yes stop_codon:yes gene_type:complete
MTKGLPMYISISKEIINKIESGTFQAGDKIPSENELIKQYNISNTTARKCLQEIELQGWANRIKGKGTFVLNRSVDRHITRVLGVFDAVKESFNDRLIREGFTPKNIVLEKTILLEGISSNINNRHCIMEGPVLKIHRLRYADDVLLKDETKYISMTLCPKINMQDLYIGSLISLYEKKYQLKLKNVERTIGCTIFNPQDPKNYFKNDIPKAIFILNGAIFLQDNKIVEIENSYYNGDKYKFTTIVKPQLINGKELKAKLNK